MLVPRTPATVSPRAFVLVTPGSSRRTPAPSMVRAPPGQAAPHPCWDPCAPVDLRAMAGGGWNVLIVLAAAQFLVVLDQAVMNVSISQLVDDFDTTVTTIQAVIALYALVMAGLMLTGGKIGDIIGRRRAFAIGLVIYGAGSGLTA